MIGLVPDIVCGLAEKVYVPVPVAVMVPLLVSPPWKSKESFPEFVNVPVLVKSPVNIFAPRALLSFKVPLFVMVLSAVKLDVDNSKVIPAGIVRALFTVVFPVKVFVPEPPNTKLL